MSYDFGSAQEKLLAAHVLLLKPTAVLSPGSNDALVWCSGDVFLYSPFICFKNFLGCDMAFRTAYVRKASLQHEIFHVWLNFLLPENTCHNVGIRKASVQYGFFHVPLNFLHGENTCHTVCIHTVFLQYGFCHVSLNFLLG